MFEQLGRIGQEPNRQKLGGTGQAPNRQKLGGTGQEPNRQKIRKDLKAFWPSLCAVGVLLGCTVVALGCSGPSQQIGRFASLAEQIPADTPFAFMNAAEPSSPSQAPLPSELPELFRVQFQGWLGIDLFDPTQLAAAGLDVSAPWAIFGVGLDPAFIVKVSDRERLNGFMTELDQRSKLDAEQHKIDGRPVLSLRFGTKRLSMGMRGDHLVGVYHSAEEELETLLLPLFRLDPQQTLAREEDFTKLRSLFVDEAEVLAFVRMTRLQRTLAARAEGQLQARLRFLPEQKHQSFLDRERAFLNRCASAGEELANQMPLLVLSSQQEVQVDQKGVVSAQQLVQRVLLLTTPELKQQLSQVFEPQAGLFHALGPDALLRFSLSVRLEALAQLDFSGAELLSCPDLAAFSGARAVLSQQIAKTDLRQVFNGPIEAALYAFDLNIPMLSKRSGVLLLPSEQAQT
ncbi:MAG: hypothetical protein RBU37_20300, partial [Myxococcota bacterium]|nr:hypothetical protein [Myxococcota bacterium]